MIAVMVVTSEKWLKFSLVIAINEVNFELLKLFDFNPMILLSISILKFVIFDNNEEFHLHLPYVFGVWYTHMVNGIRDY